jgi:hypothetical protein
MGGVMVRDISTSPEYSGSLKEYYWSQSSDNLQEGCWLINTRRRVTIGKRSRILLSNHRQKGGKKIRDMKAMLKDEPYLQILPKEKKKGTEQASEYMEVACTTGRQMATCSEQRTPPETI